jgi:hypothetical protein
MQIQPAAVVMLADRQFVDLAGFEPMQFPRHAQLPLSHRMTHSGAPFLS